MTTLTPNPTVQKSFVVGRPINATVSLEDVVTVNITLVDENEDAVNLTSCTVQASTVDTIGHLWGTVVTDAVHGKFQFTFQPLVVGRTELYAMVTKNNGVGQDETTTTFYLGDFSVAYGEQTPQAHIISLTAQLQQAATDANNAAASATSAASSATSAASTATSAATSATTAAQAANTAAARAEAAAESVENFIDDTSTALNKVWSASKVNGLIGNVESLLEALL